MGSDRYMEPGPALFLFSQAGVMYIFSLKPDLVALGTFIGSKWMVVLRSELARTTRH